MNKLQGKITNIESSEHISIVDIDVEGDLFSSIIIETPETADYLRIGNEVFMLFKETEVSIGKALSGKLSLRNRLKSKIKTIERGAVLSEIVLDYKGKDIISIITTRSTNKLDLKVGDEVQGLVKANEVTIMTADHEPS